MPARVRPRRSWSAMLCAGPVLLLAAAILASSSDGATDQPPSWSELPTFYATEDEPFAVDLSPYVSDPDTPLSGLSLSEDTGIPRVSGLSVTVTFEGGGLITIILEVCDGTSRSPASVNFTVNSVNDPPRISMVQLPDASPGEPYSFNLTATDPDDGAGELRWSDDCPLFDISPSGEIAFTPTAWDVGCHSLLATVKDPHGARDTVQLVLFVEGGYPSWSFGYIPPQFAIEREVFMLDLSKYVSGPPGPLPPDWPWHFTYRDDALEIETDPETGILTWDRPTHEDLGDHYVTVTVLESHSYWRFKERALKITVVRECIPLVDAGPDLWVDQGVDFYLQPNGSFFTSLTWSYMYDGTRYSVKGNDVRLSFAEPGTVIVTLEASDRDGCYATDTRVVHVRDTMAPEAVARVCSIVTAGKAAVLDGSSSTDNVGVVDYRWSVCGPGGWAYLAGRKVNCTFNTTGTHGILLEVADAAGNKASGLLTVIAIDVEPPFAEAGWNRTVPLGGLVLLDARNSTDNVGIARYSWQVSGPDGSRNLEGGLAQAVLAMPGEYTVTLAVVDASGNVDTDDVTLWVPSEGPQGQGSIGLAWVTVVTILVGGSVLLAFGLRHQRMGGRA